MYERFDAVSRARVVRALGISAPSPDDVHRALHDPLRLPRFAVLNWSRNEFSRRLRDWLTSDTEHPAWIP